MRMNTGTVRAGTIVLEGEPLPEGARVVVLLREVDDEDAELSEDEELLLADSIREADAGDVVSAADVLRELATR